MSVAGALGGVQLQDVTAAYGAVAALREVTLAVPPGQTVALVGPSGAGKTTLLRLLNGAVTPVTGDVTVDGSALATLTPDALRRLRSRIGFVHQDLRLVPNLRVSQNVLSGRLGRRSLVQAVWRMLRPDPKELQAVHRMLEKVGIAEQMFQRVDRLSGGQAQRVAIARALYQEPRLLLADEPVASVDPARAAALLDLLTTIGAEAGLTLVVSLHDPDLARQYFQRLIGLRDGRVVFDARAEEVTDAQLTALYALEAGREL